MSSHQRQHDKEKERLREKAQRERANKANTSTSESSSKPLFDKPSKVQSTDQRDVIDKRICRVLGQWDVSVIKSNKPLLGVLPSPATPQPDTSDSKKEFTFKQPSKTNNGAFRPGEHKSHESSRRSLEGSSSKPASSEPDSKGGESKFSHGSKRDETKPGHDHKRSRDHSGDSGKSSEHRGHHSNHHRNRMPSDGGGGSEGGGGRRSHSSERSSQPKHSSNSHSSSTFSQQSSLNNSQSPAKPSIQLAPSPLSTQSKHQHHSRRSTSPSSSQATAKSHPSSNAIVSSPRKSPSSTNSKPVFQHPTLKASSGSCNNSPATNPQASLMAPRASTPPNGIYSRGPLAKHHKKLPNLLMPSCENNKSSSVGFEGLHDIFKEMINIPVPVSEINTPRKSEDKLSFPLPPKPEKEVAAPVTEVTSTAKPDEEEEEEKKSQVSSLSLSENSLEKDLDISDDSETEQASTDIPPSRTQSAVTTKKREGEVGMSSGSDSSSEGSDSSSDSDGETSSSEDEGGKEAADKAEVKKEEEQSVTPKETPSWGLGSFLKQLKRSSPEAPIPKKSSEKQKEIDETNDEMLEEILHTAITSQHPLKEIGHTPSLPFSTDHLDPDFESERHQNGADSGCDLPGNNDRTNTSMGSLGSPDTASTCSSTSSKPSSGKPEKKGRGRPSLSSMSDSAHRTSKSSDVSSSQSKSNSSSASKPKSTPKKDSKKDKSKSAHDEKKRRKTDFKSKPTISDSDDSEIDVVSVTPGKTTSSMANSIFDEDKDKVRSKLFSSPKANKSSPVKVSHSQEKDSKSVSKDKSREVKHKTSSHRKKDRDRDKEKSDSLERSKKKDHKKLSPSSVTDSKMDVDSDKHVEDIIQTTSEFKPPSLLSPIPTFSSPTKIPFPSLSSPSCPSPRAASPTCPRLTYSNGKPAIMVEINLSLLDSIPSSANSQSASSPPIGKSDNKTSNVADTDKKSSSMGDKTGDLFNKNADITPKSADVIPKSADKNVDSTEKKQDTSDKCAKLEKIAKNVDKSTKNVEKSANSLDKSVTNVDKSVDSTDKHASMSVECSKDVDMCEDSKESESQVPVMQDKASRSHKRKSDSDRHESSSSSSSSKRHKSSSKSSKKSTGENLHNGSSGHQVESKEGESAVAATVKVPTSSGERRNSTSSTSSRHSTSTSSKSKKIKIEDKIKREIPSPDKHMKKEKNDISQQNGQDHLPFLSYNEGQGTVKSEVVENGPQFSSIGQYHEDRLEPAEKYLSKAKELKHLADKDKPAKFSLYVKSVLSFVQCGCAMEKEAISEPQKIFTMYHETLQLLKQVIRVRGTCIDPDVPITDKRLSVLLLRIQSLLCLKLYNLKRSEVMKFKKIIDADNNKTATAKSPHQSTMYNRSIGTPPPISPTPSPAGSIGSVGSQGSCDLTSSKLTNGNLSSNTTPMSSPGTVSISQRIHSVTQQYIHLTGYFVTCHDLWLQADVAALEFKEFFNMLDNTCGPLSLHSSVLHLVRYVNEGLQMMKDT